MSQTHITGFLCAASIQEAELAFVVTRTYPYMPNIVSDEDFEPSEIS
jgi:hypothetical protein